MAWTATLRDAKRSASNGQWDVSIVYTDGVKTVLRGFAVATLSDDAIKALARADVASFTTADTTVVTLPLNSVIDLTPPVVTPPVPDPLRDTFFTNYRAMQALMRLVDLGVLSSTDTRVTNLRATLVSTFLPAYLTGA